MTYITANGQAGKEELATHYVTICNQIAVLDKVLGRSSVNIYTTGVAQEVNLAVVEKALDVNDKMWNRRELLVAHRADAIDALNRACANNAQRIEQLISQAAEAAEWRISN